MRDSAKAPVLKKLKVVEDNERIALLDKYCKQIGDVFQNLSAQEYIDISIDILLLKTSKEDLIDSYVKADPVIDQPGCKLHEFLNKELVN